MVSPNFNIIESETGFVVTDTTNYFSEQYIGVYALNDYINNPTLTPNTVFSTTSIEVNGVVIFDDAIEYSSDSSGDITDPEQAYNYIVGKINEGDGTYKARLDKGDNPSWRTWRVEIYSFNPLTDNNAITVSTTGGNITPFTVNFIGTPSGITYRNLLVINPDDEVFDLGGVAQVDEITFNLANYTEGGVISVSFCEDIVNYTVVNTDRDCIIADIVSLINVDDPTKRYYSLTAIKDENKIVITQESVGVPFSVSISGAEPIDITVDAYTVETTTPNVSTMSLPSNATENESVDIVEVDRGGKYIVSLSVGSVCDNGTNTVEYFSWVYDEIQLDCCFNSMISKKSCCSSTTEQILKTSTLRNIIYGAEILQRDGGNPADIQSLYDLGWDSCESKPCCSDC